MGQPPTGRAPVVTITLPKETIEAVDKIATPKNPHDQQLFGNWSLTV
jgi:hypothetical protein